MISASAVKNDDMPPRVHFNPRLEIGLTKISGRLFGSSPSPIGSTSEDSLLDRVTSAAEGAKSASFGSH